MLLYGVPFRGGNMVYYFVCFVITWVLTAIYFYKWKNTYNAFITLAFFAVDIMNFGYWQESISKTVREAIIARYCVYFGASFVALLTMFSIFDMCKIQIKKIYRFGFFMLSMVTYVGSLTIGYAPYFYKSVTLGRKNGAYMLIKEYGPLHTVYYLTMGLNFLVAIVALVYSLKKKSGISRKNAVLLLTCFLLCILSFVAGRVLGTLDLISAAANFVLLTYIFISGRFILYDVDATAMQTLQKSNFVGIVSLDRHRCFLGCNQTAKEYFPELGHLRIDRVVTEPMFLEWISEMEKNHELKKMISNQGRFYTLEGQYRMEGKKMRGLQFILQDCTDEVNYREYLKKVAVTDDITQLFNRHAFEDEIAALEKKDFPENLIVISFDLNGLKKVNDSIGHYAGDELICAAAKTISEVFSPLGKTFRIGGDEFEAVVYCNREVLEKALLSFTEKCRSWRGMHSQQLSVSTGYALGDENPSMDIHALVREADRQMYADKAAYYRVGGNDRRRRQ